MPTKDKIILEATILFAQKGYCSVTMRDIANATGIQPGSIYAHFESKEELMHTIFDLTESLYKTYTSQIALYLETAASFEEALDYMFKELTADLEIFSHYGFCFIATEQFHIPRAHQLFNELYLDTSIHYIQRVFERYVEKKLIPPFDTVMAATILIHSVLIGLELRVHEYLGHPLYYNTADMFTQLQQYILRIARAGIQ